MKLEGKKILLTGASGGIGSQLAQQLTEAGARLALIGRNGAQLEKIAGPLRNYPHAPITFAVDLLDRKSREASVEAADSQLGGIDILINNAGMQSFRPFHEEDPETIERTIQLNTLVPMQLTRQLLPGMLQRKSGRIVNVGSTFGSIAFAWFASYSTSKFGLRGFSEALRRELADSGVGVTYVAPRAVKTDLNSAAVYRMSQKVKMNMDSPEWVAEKIVNAMQKEADDIYLGFPESLFVRINALLPRFVDNAMKKQNQKMGLFAKEVTL